MTLAQLAAEYLRLMNTLGDARRAFDAFLDQCDAQGHTIVAILAEADRILKAREGRDMSEVED